MADDEPKRNKGGRPRKHPGEGRRPTLATRVRGGLYEKLKEAADQSERTVSEEMERRLEKSFEYDEIISQKDQIANDLVAKYENQENEFMKHFGGKVGFYVASQYARSFIETIKEIDAETGEQNAWLKSDQAFEMLVECIFQKERISLAEFRGFARFLDAMRDIDAPKAIKDIGDFIDKNPDLKSAIDKNIS